MACAITIRNAIVSAIGSTYSGCDFARQDANPQFKLGEKLVRRYQQKLYLTDRFADLREIKIDIIPNQRITLPDGLGEFIALRQEKLHQFSMAG